MAVLLANRGLESPAAARAFLRREPACSADPFALPGMPGAVTRLLRALEAGERISVYGDYDADGLTATALLVTVLRDLEADVRGGAKPGAGPGAAGAPSKVDWHIPNRTAEGYGLNGPALERIREAGYSLVVTVDCGVTAVEEASLARAIGLDLIITDHHQPGPVLPKAVAVVNPRLPGGGYPFTELAGVGVAYKLAQALAVARSAGLRQMTIFDTLNSPSSGPGPAGGPPPPLERWAHLLDLVALGTVADVVPLLDENRQLVQRGLELFNPPLRPGLRALWDVANARESGLASGTARPARTVGTYHLGFQFGPRLNAAGRVGDAERGLRLLLATDRGEAERWARELDAANRERQKLEEEILEKAVAEVEKAVDLETERAILVAGQGWNEGVIGIVATRLVERYARPALLVAVNDGMGRGSGRSIPAFDLAGALEACAHRLGRHGGHRMAAGFELTEADIAAFRADFLELARQRLSREDLVHELRIDACVEFSDLASQALVPELEAFGPHGTGNPEPVLALGGVTFTGVRTVGEGGKHLKAIVRPGAGPATPARNRPAGALEIGCVGFGLGQLATGLGPGSLWDIAFRPGLDEWNGARRVELKLVDIRPAGTGVPAHG